MRGKDALVDWCKGQRLGFVPTMGALHSGHRALIERSQCTVGTTLVSIFVNPLQFGPQEDYATYPRPLDRDLALLEEWGADAVFIPSVEDMYPQGSTQVFLSSRSGDDLCGRRRPGHFDGVLTVVLKLFHMIQPVAAFFGKKDYQQFTLIKRMVTDLDLNIEIIPVETQREESGLAISSRNLGLSQTERRQASHIYASLSQVKHLYAAGERDPQRLSSKFRDSLEQHPDLKLEYFEVREQQELQPFDHAVNRPSIALAAVHLGRVRLIDNLELD